MVASQCFCAVYEGEIIGFIAMIHFPHPIAKNVKRVHRLVVLPDYQGIGVGIKLLNSVAAFYKQDGFRVRIVTTTPALIYSLQKHGWRCTRFGRLKLSDKKTGLKALSKTISFNRITASFEY